MSESSGNIDSLIDFTIFIFDGCLALSKVVDAVNDSTGWEFNCTISVMDKSIDVRNTGGSFSKICLLGVCGSSLGFLISSNDIINSGSISSSCDFSGLSISLSLVFGFIFFLSSRLGKRISLSIGIVISRLNTPGEFDSLSLTDKGKNCD